MDGHRFDALAIRFASGASRRKVLTGLGAGVLALVAGVFVQQPAGAQGDERACAEACQQQFPAKTQRGARRRCVSTCVLAAQQPEG